MKSSKIQLINYQAKAKKKKEVKRKEATLKQLTAIHAVM